MKHSVFALLLVAVCLLLPLPVAGSLDAGRPTPAQVVSPTGLAYLPLIAHNDTHPRLHSSGSSRPTSNTWAPSACRATASGRRPSPTAGMP